MSISDKPHGLRLLDTFVMQDLIKDKNTKMFVDQIKKEVGE